MQRRRHLFWTATCTSQCELHYKSYRAEPRRSGPSPPPLGGPGPHDICVGRARSEAFTLHQTGLGTVPSPVKLYSVNGAYVSLAFRGLSGGIAYCTASTGSTKAPFTLYNLTGLDTVPSPVWCNVNASDRARPT